MEGGDRDDFRIKLSEAAPRVHRASLRNLPNNRAHTADDERNRAVSRNRYGEDQSHQHHAGAIQIETEVINNDPTVVSPFMQLYHQAASIENAQQLGSYRADLLGLSAEGEPAQQCSSESRDQDPAAAAELMARAQEQQSHARFRHRFRGSKLVSQRTHLLQRAKAQADQ